MHEKDPAHKDFICYHYEYVSRQIVQRYLDLMRLKPYVLKWHVVKPKSNATAEERKSIAKILDFANTDITTKIKSEKGMDDWEGSFHIDEGADLIWS